MTLTTNGKNYIADKFGNASKCFVSTGLSWSYLGTDNVNYPETGGTAQIVSRLVLTGLVQSLTINGTTYTYSILKTNNDNTDIIFPDDIVYIVQNDGSPAGEPQYCVPVTGTLHFVITSGGNPLSGVSITIDLITRGLTDANGILDVLNMPMNQSITYLANKSGYDNVSGSVTLDVSPKTVNVSMNITGTTGSISGNVKDTSNNNIQGATVSDGTRSSTTDISGNYTISNVPAASGYTITASKTGYQSSTITGVVVNAGQNTTQNFTLTPILTLTSIEVTSSTGTNNVEKSKTLSLNLLCKDQSNNAMLCPTVTWTSSNNNIASVSSSGIVTGIAVGGPVTIYATSTISTSIYGTINITVIETIQSSNTGGLVLVSVAAVAGILILSTRKKEKIKSQRI